MSDALKLVRFSEVTDARAPPAYFGHGWLVSWLADWLVVSIQLILGMVG